MRVVGLIRMGWIGPRERSKMKKEYVWASRTWKGNTINTNIKIIILILTITIVNYNIDDNRISYNNNNINTNNNNKE